MNNPLHQSERYHYRQMEPDERKALEAEMAKDPDLALDIAADEALLIHRDQQLAAAMRQRGKQLLQQPEEQSTATPAFSVRSNLVRWAAAAAVVLLLGWVGMQWFSGKASATQELFATYYEAPTFSGQLSATADEAQQRWMKATDEYDKKLYATSAQTLVPLLQDPNYNNQARLLRGICMMSSDQPRIAVETFSQISPTARSLYQQGQWYSALASLKADNAPQAKATLQSIVAEPQHRYQKQAEKLLKEIK